jgi:outer membrane protein OmpA-like peptidoglycan-associated protein
MKMKLFRLIFLMSLFCAPELFAQSSFLPKNLGPNVNSIYAEINPVITQDGKTLYFNRVNHPDNYYGELDSQDIWMSDLQDDGTWGPAVRLPQSINRERHNAILSISNDGSILVNGLYNDKNQWRKRGLSWGKRISNGEWTSTEDLDIIGYSKKNKGRTSNAYMSPDHKVLLLSFSTRFDGKKNNLYMSTLKENLRWRAPKKIKKPVSSRFRDEAPFISLDGSTLYFTSNRKSGKGAHDIYSCKKLDDSYRLWSEPKLLSDTINSEEYESYYKTNLKGSWAYFCSGKNTIGNVDIFKVKIFEENPFVLVSGKIINKAKGKPLTGKSGYMILVDDKIVDSVKVNPQTAEYSFRLPLGKSYKLVGALKNYNSIPESVDVKDVREYTEMQRNLYVESFPYVLLRGQLIVKNTGSPIPAYAMPKIVADGAVIDSAIIQDNGSYTVKVPFGKNYQIQVNADKFTPVPVTLNLSEKDTYEEIDLDLYVNKVEERIAIIKGKVINNKTLKPISSDVPFTIQVNGVNFPAEIKKDSAFFEIHLDLGKNYTINAYAPNYYPVYEPVNLLAETARLTLHRTLVLTPIEVGQTVKLNNIFFATAKTILKPESFVELDKVVKFLKDNPAIKIEIGGHTDNVGNAVSNQKLSAGRAAAVEKYLESKGIHNDRIISKGYGMTKPVSENKTKEGKAKNRRVEFKILDI